MQVRMRVILMSVLSPTILSVLLLYITYNIIVKYTIINHIDGSGQCN